MIKDKFKIPQPPPPFLYVVVIGWMLLLGFLMFFLGLLAPRKPLLQITDLLAAVQFGYLIYFTYFGLYGPGIYFALLGWCAVSKRFLLSIFLLISNYAFGVWAFVYLKGQTFDRIFSSETLLFFDDLRLFIFGFLPFVLMNLTVFVVLLWPHKAVLPATPV